MTTTTCKVCANTWTGLAPCHCSNCHNTFGGITSFDLHRRGYGERGSCKDPRYMNLVLDDKGVWRQPDSVRTYPAADPLLTEAA